MKAQRIHILLLVCATLVSGLLMVGDNTARAASSQKDTAPNLETQNPVEGATVNLYCRLRSGRKIFSSSGSGVFISDRGVILTNAHVAQYFLLAEKEGRVTGRCSVRTGSPAKERYVASAIYFPSVWAEQNAAELSKSKPKGTGENDFALLYITATKKKGVLPVKFPALTIDLSNSTTDQEAVTIAGYPSEKLDFDGVRNKLAMVTASSTITNTRSLGGNQSMDVLTLAPSAAGGAGVSGGPIIDGAGEVIGIVTSKSTAKDDRTLRAITLPYIDRTIQSQANISLSALLVGDFKAQANSVYAIPSPEIIKIIAKGLLGKK